MLEHAELSIREADNLASSVALAKENEETTDVKKGIALLKQQWSATELPEDVKRLAQNVTSLIKAARLETTRLDGILNEAKAHSESGTHSANLSPFAIIVQCLLNAERDKMLQLLQRDKSRNRVLIAGEVDFPADINRSLLKNAIFAPGT